MERIRQRCDKRLAGLKANRVTWEEQWPELELLWPCGARINADNDPRSFGGEDRQGEVYDSTHQTVLDKAVAGFMAYATSPARQWHRNTTRDLDEDDSEAREHLDAITDVQRSAMQAGNFYQVLPHVYREGLVFGTGAMIGLPDFETVLHWYPMVTGTYWLGANAKQVVDTCYREFWMTTSQLVERFGLERCSIAVQNAAKRPGNQDDWHKVVHVIEPRKNAGGGPMATQMPWASYYYEAGSADGDHDLLEEGGFLRFPVIAWRYQREGNNVYGRSPCMKALPLVRQVQLQTLAEGRAIERDYVDPPVQLPTSAKNEEVNLAAGGINYVDESRQSGGIRRVFDQPTDPSWMRESKADARMQVATMLFLDLFQMLALQPQTEKTKFEVAQRVKEGMQLMGPVLNNLITDVLSPVLDLYYYTLEAGGAFPPVPESLSGKDFVPEFMSELWMAQKAADVGTIGEFLAFVGSIAQGKGDPSVWDAVNLDDVVRDVANKMGVPAKLLESPEDVQALRQARADAQAAQAQLAAMQSMASTTKDIASAVPSLEASTGPLQNTQV